MGSFFRTSYSSAHPILFGMFVDPTQLATFTDSDGNQTTRLEVVWRAESTELVENSQGDLVDARITQVVVRTEDLPEVDLLGFFTYQNEDWDIDAREGRGVEWNSPDSLLAHLIQRDAVTICRSGRRGD